MATTRWLLGNMSKLNNRRHTDIFRTFRQFWSVFARFRAFCDVLFGISGGPFSLCFAILSHMCITNTLAAMLQLYRLQGVIGVCHWIGALEAQHGWFQQGRQHLEQVLMKPALLPLALTYFLHSKPLRAPRCHGVILAAPTLVWCSVTLAWFSA